MGFADLNLSLLNRKNMGIKGFIERIKNIIERIRRVLLVSTKPSKDEFIQTVKVTGLGIIVIGIIGFVIFLAIQAIGGL